MKLYRIGSDQKEITGIPRRTMKSLNMTETSHLEDWVLAQGGAPFDKNVVWIARQDTVTSDKRSDLLGVDSEGNLVVCELKRGKADEQAVIQALGYAAEYRHVDIDGLSEVLFRHAKIGHLGTARFVDPAEAREHVNASVAHGSAAAGTEVAVNQSQVIVIVAEEFHSNMLAICDYLNNASTALTYWFECWQYELFTDDAKNGGTYVTFTQILPPVNVRSEIAERRDAERSRKYVRDPDRINLSKALQEQLEKHEALTTSRKQGASYTFSVASIDHTREFVVTVGDDNPWLIVPDESVAHLPEGAAVHEAKLGTVGGRTGFHFEKYAANDTGPADELARSIAAVIDELVESGD